MAPGHGKKDIRLIYNPSDHLPCVIGHQEKLKEVFANLISNAIKYNMVGGSITILHELTPHTLQTTIRDTGTGIVPENLEKIFTPYFCVGADKTVPGSGLDLYIVKKLLEQMDGTISVSSVPGSGTVFTVSLPLQNQ